MAWVSVPGLNGKIFLPDSDNREKKKHPCKGCFSCQMCSDDRCHACLGNGPETGCCNTLERPADKINIYQNTKKKNNNFQK